MQIKPVVIVLVSPHDVHEDVTGVAWVGIFVTVSTQVEVQVHFPHPNSSVVPSDQLPLVVEQADWLLA